MIEISEAEFVAAKRRRDRKSGLVQPWFTHGALDEIETWDLRGKRILEWGGGLSTFWWGDRVGHGGYVLTVEHVSSTWIAALASEIENYHQIELQVLGEATGLDATEYSRTPPGRWDVVVVDGEPCHMRTDCLRAALLLPRPLILICDNWMQDYVYDDPVAEILMAPFAASGAFYIQPDHTDHAGRPWRTAIWRL